MNHIVAIIVTFNRKELLKEAIDALCHQTVQKFDIMIVDNASTDGTKEYISDYLESERICYFNTGANIGPRRGVRVRMPAWDASQRRPLFPRNSRPEHS